MLQSGRLDTPLEEQFVDDGGGLDFDYLLAFARRRARIVIVFCLLGLVIGFGYLATAIPLYTASTRVLVDSPDNLTAQQVSGISDIAVESGKVDSLVELIRSDTISGQVVDALKLFDNSGFMQEPGSPVSIVRRWIGSVLEETGNRISGVFLPLLIGDNPDGDGVDVLSAADLTDLDSRNAAIKLLQGNFSVRRIKRTYVLDLAYTSRKPQLAAQIANGYANAFLNDQLESKYQATRRAGDWLQNRTEELRRKFNEAELAIEAFRRSNNLIATSGTLISDQQLSGLNSQLIIARTEVSRAKARYQRLSSLIEEGRIDAVVSETLSQTITSGLRSRYLEASKRYAEISTLLGKTHTQAVRLRNEMFQLQRLMFEELKRVAEVARNDLATAQQRERALKADLDVLVISTEATNETQIQLRELERKADTLKNLYTTFSQRYQESLQTQSFPIATARIITRAEPPPFPSSPRRARTLILALFLGGAVGVSLAAFAEFRDRVFRTGDQVREELKLEFIGMLTEVKPKRSSRVALKKRQRNAAKMAKAEPAEKSLEEDEFSPGAYPPLVIGDAIMQYAIDTPLSGFTETLRSAKVAIDLTLHDKPSKVIGIVSVLPNEGKTTVSKNLATLVASQGSRVLLIDGDIRKSDLTRGCAKDTEIGLVEVVTGDVPWTSVFSVEEESGLFFLPTAIKQQVSHTSDILSSPVMRALLDDARAHFDYIFIDLPPMGPVVDTRAILPYLDAMLLVVEWGKTNRALVANIFSEDPRYHQKTLGVILNKVDKNRLKMYEGYGSGSYYNKAYERYYTS